ncbi:S8 family serine peptidase [Bailinhaonella thermotolerans]|uniref:Peptidase S8 n=1 Tax=Bailinhaonella thermotolerans TaxID=1070861 RepID=A0A3A4AYZ9_9ACTN|nr:S8 family serine peptidase [Bailinhaonella thermotolerans]RJL32736.1 peptidase S8 [Bailinhaonella thermotolerans]
MYIETTDIYPDMDPRLQRALDRRERGDTTVATASSEEDEIGVLALVDDVDRFADRDGVRLGAVIGEVDGRLLVTARVPLSRVEEVRRAPGVRSMKCAQPLRPTLQATVPEIRADRASAPPGSLAGGGAGVLVGVVDTGLDFAHRNFRRADGSTRVVAIWDQSGASTPGSPFGYGRRHGAADIDRALGQADPYEALGYGPVPDQPGRPKGTHGTHVCDIAAGNGLGSGVAGVAPEADIAFAEPAVSDVAWQGQEVVGQFFGDSVQLLEAVRFLFNEAGERPCVVNISLGTHGGPHDGSSLAERGIDAMIAERPGRAVVISAGNSFERGVHAAGTVPPGGRADVRVAVPELLTAQCEVELWYAGGDVFRAELISPGGDVLGPVALGSNARVRADDGTTLLFVSHRANDPGNGDNVLGLFLDERVPPGVWTVRLHGERVVSGGYHAWIERNDSSQASFAGEPRDDSHTIGSISCGRLALAVGSYDAHVPGRPLSRFTASGPTRDGRAKPELSAPGHDVFAAHSRTGTGVVRKSGTSMAAPAVAGLAALVLAEARARGVSLPAGALRSVLTETARVDPPPVVWDPRYGHGRADAAECLRAVRELSPAGEPSGPGCPQPGGGQTGLGTSGVEATGLRTGLETTGL